MSKETIYKQKDGVSGRRLGEDLMLYDPESDKVHVLNETAALIWNLLDGTNTIEKIEEILRQTFKDAKTRDISGDVKETLEKLKQEGLIRRITEGI